MNTYLVSFDRLERISSKIDETGKRGIYWETPTRFIVEVPVVSNRGSYMGVTWRCEILKSTLESLMARKVAVPPEEMLVERLFENIFLSEYIKVEGKFGEEEEAEPLPELPSPFVSEVEMNEVA